jgi:hypothetical protein
MACNRDIFTFYLSVTLRLRYTFRLFSRLNLYVNVCAKTEYRICQKFKSYSLHFHTYIAYFVVTSFPSLLIRLISIRVYAAMLNLQGEEYLGLRLWRVLRILSQVSSYNSKSINALIYLEWKSISCFSQL